MSYAFGFLGLLAGYLATYVVFIPFFSLDGLKLAGSARKMKRLAVSNAIVLVLMYAIASYYGWPPGWLLLGTAAGSVIADVQLTIDCGTDSL